MAVDNKVSPQSSEKLSELIGSTGFDRLNDELKGEAITAFKEAQATRDNNQTGLLGRLFGNKAENISLYIAFVICLALIVVGVVYICISPEYKQNTNLEFWQIIGPIITGALGYIFGAGAKS